MDSKRAVVGRVVFFLACLGVALGLVACGGGGDEGGDQATPGAGTGTPSAGTRTPSSATAAPSGKTVEITLWHSEIASNLNAIQDLARRFNESQSEVKVKLSFQGTSDENMAKVLASLRGGQAPTIAYLDEIQAQRLIDSGGFRPVQDFIDKESYDLSGF